VFPRTKNISKVSARQQRDMDMDLPHVVQPVANLDCVRLILELNPYDLFMNYPLSAFIPYEVGGRHITGVPTRYWEGGGNASYVCQRIL